MNEYSITAYKTVPVPIAYKYTQNYLIIADT
jgi:hypothetical protein